MNIVRQTIQRADPQVIEKLGQAGVATVHEAMGRRGLMAPACAPVQQDLGLRIGRDHIRTSQITDDPCTLEQLQRGTSWFSPQWRPVTWGILGPAGHRHGTGCRAIVIDAGVRDTRDLRAMGFGVWSTAISAQGTVKATLGSVNVPIVRGCVRIAGDVIVADDDGVCVVPVDEANSVLQAAKRRMEAEVAKRERQQPGNWAGHL